MMELAKGGMERGWRWKTKEVNRTGKGKRGITRRFQRDALNPETISFASITSCRALIPYLPAESSGARTCNLGEIKQRKHTPHYFINLGSYFEFDGLVFGGSTDQARLLSMFIASIPAPSAPKCQTKVALSIPQSRNIIGKREEMRNDGGTKLKPMLTIVYL